MLVPKLRFKEFRSKYVEYKLKDIVDFYKGNILSKSDIAMDGKIPCILYGELYTKYSEITRFIISHTNNKSENLFYSRVNDVLIPCSGETALDISTSTCVLLDNVALGGDLNVLRPKKYIDGKYLSYLLSNKKRITIAKYAQGDSIVHLYADKIKNISIILPSLDEQRKVSFVLELLNKKIELQQGKIEALKMYKKGLMSKVFENSKNSKITKLKDICMIEKGKQLNQEKMINNGKYYVLNGGSELSGYTDSYNTDENTISISEGGNSCGFVNYNIEKFWAGGHCYVLKNIVDNINKEYLFQILKYNQERIMKLRVGSGLPNIQKKSIENFEIKIFEVEHQRYLAQLLNKIDYKIAVENKRYNSLLSIKKSLLQQMFT